MSALLCLLGIVIIWTLLNLAYKTRKEWFQKHNIEVGFISLMWRSSVAEKWMRFTEKHSKAINIYGHITIPIALATLAFALKIYLEDFIALIRILTKPKVPAAPGGAPPAALPTPMIPIIPGLTVSFDIVPYLLVALAIGAFLHELSHLMLSFRENIPVKSWGIMIFLVIPIPFVEPVEEEFKKKPLMSKIKVYTSGPATNTILALISLGLVLLLIAASYNITMYPYIVDLMPGYPAEQAGVPKGVVVLSVNNSSVMVKPSPIDVVFNPYIGLSKFMKELSKYKFKNASITLVLSKPGMMNKTFTITLFKNASLDKIGVYVSIYTDIKTKIPFMETMVPYMLTTLMWLFIVNLGLALINITPLFITDGGKIVSDFLEAKIKNKTTAKTIANIIQAIMVIMVLSIIMYSTLRL